MEQNTITLSDDQEIAFKGIAEWLATGKTVPGQINPHLLTFAGFAGTGKTTITSILAKTFGKSIRFAFCALSGRAASVLGKKLRDQGINLEESNHYCGTIHGLIYTPLENEKGEVIHWLKKELLDYDVIVIDEASMISQDIYQDLASYGVDILAVGDHGQLPPIEGKFSLMEKPNIKLEQIHRQAEGNPIINLSMQVRRYGKIPKDYTSNNCVSIVTKKDYIDLLRGIFQTNKTSDDLLEIAVLCYKNATRNSLNKAIRKMVFGSDCSLVPQTNDLVICLRNSSKKSKKQLPLYNGYRGYVSSAVSEVEDFYYTKIDFPSENIHTKPIPLCKYQFGYPKTFSSFEELEQFGIEIIHWNQAGYLFDYGYALTVHKFQGSQANNVIIFNEWPTPVSAENYKRWLYTAITRSSDKLTIIL
jgi:exodeoxyribonuclease V